MMAKWPWRSRSMTSIFNTSTSWGNPKMHIWCKFLDSSSNPLQVIMQTSQISKNSKSKWPKWPWMSRSMTSSFNTSQEYHRMHVWCKFGDSSHICDKLSNFLEFWVKMSKMTLKEQMWWFQLKPVTSYCVDKVKFTDERMHAWTDWQTQATTIPLRPERPTSRNDGQYEGHTKSQQYSDITRASWHFKSLASWLFVQQLFPG